MPTKIDNISDTTTVTMVEPMISFLVGHVTLVSSVRVSFKNLIIFCTIYLFIFAGQEGLEPPTAGFGDRNSTT